MTEINDNAVEVKQTNSATKLIEEGVAPGFTSLLNMKSAYEMAKMLACSKVIPKSYQNNPADCMIAVDMSVRMDIPVMFVMQNMYTVHGMPTWSGKACIALLQNNKTFGDINYIYTGEKGTESYGCHIETTRVSDGKKICGTLITMKMANDEHWTKNEKWHTMPDQMLAYRAASFFARMYIPYALMGINVEGEAEDIVRNDREKNYTMDNPLL